MDCKIEKNQKNGKINKVIDKTGNKSVLFQQILDVPTLNLTEAIDIYKNIYSDKFKPVEIEDVKDAVQETSPIEVKISDAKVEIEAPEFITASQMKKAETSEKMMEIRERQDTLKKRFQELEKLNNCLWN